MIMMEALFNIETLFVIYMEWLLFISNLGHLIIGFSRFVCLLVNKFLHTFRLQLAIFLQIKNFPLF